MKNIYFILFLFTFSTYIMCFDDMIAMLPSLRTSTQKKSFLKKEQNATLSNDSTIVINISQKCADFDFFVKVDKEITDELNELKSDLMKKSIKLENKIKAEKNNTKKEEYKQQLKTIVEDDITVVKEVEDVYNVLRKHTYRLRDKHCKKDALNKLNTAKQNINSFIQTMKTVLEKAGKEDSKLTFL